VQQKEVSVPHVMKGALINIVLRRALTGNKGSHRLHLAPNLMDVAPSDNNDVFGWT
jgi:hypothetical protein